MLSLVAVRMQRSVCRVTSAPQTRAEGRRPAPLAVVAERSTFDLDDAAARYVVERVSQAAVDQADKAAKAAARKRVSRARERLAVLEGGQQEVQRIHVALAHESGRIPRLARTADVELRPFVASLAMRFVAYLREHRPQTTAGIGRLYSSAASDALAGAIEERLFALGVRGVVSATRTTKGEDGAQLSVGLPAVEALLKLRLACLSAARLDLLAASQAEAQARESGGHAPHRDPQDVHPLLQARRNRITSPVEPEPAPDAPAEADGPEAEDEGEDAAAGRAEAAPVHEAAPPTGHCGSSKTGCWRGESRRRTSASAGAAGAATCRRRGPATTCGPRRSSASSKSGWRVSSGPSHRARSRGSRRRAMRSSRRAPSFDVHGVRRDGAGAAWRDGRSVGIPAARLDALLEGRRCDGGGARR